MNIVLEGGLEIPIESVKSYLEQWRKNLQLWPSISRDDREKLHAATKALEAQLNPRTRYTVKYRIKGFPKERQSGPYDTREVALSHKDDIVGFEGCEYAVVEPAP